MFQAQQKAVVQEANISLVNIRYMEIQYFSQFFLNFGTQCFVLAGIICGSISQTPQLDGAATCPYFFVILYNSAAAMVVALATLGMLASVFIAVFGEGLAIRGPLGSLVKTIDGMVAEQHQAVILFIGAAISFQLQLVGMSWIMMDQAVAITVSIIVALYAIYTYQVATRIYNRFWWDKTRSDWKDEVDRVVELNDLDPTVDELNNEYGKKKVEQALRVSLHRGYLNNGSSEAQQRSVLSNMLKILYPSKGKAKGASDAAPATSTAKRPNANYQPSENNSELLDPNHPYYDGQTVVSDSPYLEINDSAQAVSFADRAETESNRSGITDVKASGYLTVKTKAKTGLMGGHPWERRYFIIRKSSIYYYKDRRSFELEPSKPLNHRPIDLEGFSLHAESEEPPFILSLIPIEEDDIRKNWVFRADTVNEFRSWKEIFTAALQAANSSRKA